MAQEEKIALILPLAIGRNASARKLGILRINHLSAAFFALADFAQVIPGIYAAGVAVIPGDVQRIPAHRLYFFGLGGFLVHGQESGRLLGRLAGVAMVIVALFRAGGAGACVTQPLE